MAGGRLTAIRAYAVENGWYLTTVRALGKAWRRVRDGWLAKALRTEGLGLGRNPRLGGVKYIQMGVNFSSADDLWLEAIAEYCGNKYEPRLVIGRDCNVSSYVHIACTNRVTIGDGMLCGSHVIISDHGHGIYRGAGQSGPGTRPAGRPLSRDGAVVIGNNVWIGDGVAVLAGAVIGDGAVIGAHSVVTGVVPAGTICAGAPARVIRRWDEGVGEWVRAE